MAPPSALSPDPCFLLPMGILLFSYMATQPAGGDVECLWEGRAVQDQLWAQTHGLLAAGHPNLSFCLPQVGLVLLPAQPH